MKVSRRILVIAISALILGVNGVSYAMPGMPARAPAAVVKKAGPAQNNDNWHTASGRVLEANIADNTLLLNSHGKDLKFQVPGRVDMLNLKHGQRVTVVYVAEGKQLHLWKLNTR